MPEKEIPLVRQTVRTSFTGLILLLLLPVNQISLWIFPSLFETHLQYLKHK
jgi:hypothetical protein